MSQYEKELDVIATRINTAKNLLKSFLSFCEEPETKKPFPRAIDFNAYIVWWLEEMKTKKSILESAIFTLEYEEDLLISLFEVQEAAEANGQ